MSEWQECKLGDVVRFGNGKSRPTIEGIYPIYGGNGILGYTAETNYDGETVVIGRVGAYCGATYYENKPIWVSDNALSAKPKNGNDAKFVYFFLKNMDLNQHAQGSSHPLVTQTLLNSIDVEIPTDYKVQKAIANILSSLDDKIDLLHRQNKTLEAMAETLFRQWFIEEAQEDWEFVELGNYANCFNGVSYKSSDLNSSKIAMVTLKSFDRNGGFRLDGFKEFTGKYKEQHIVKQGDLVVAHTDITQDADVIGSPVLVVEDSNYDELIISMDLVKVTSKYEWLSNEFLYRMMRTREFKQHCLGCSNGSTVLHLNKQAIPSYEFFLPPENKIKAYTIQAKSVLQKKFKNIAQIKTLEKLRDNLLPKLMSGEVRVSFS
jgi:type I restriction enzyme S subunit